MSFDFLERTYYVSTYYADYYLLNNFMDNESNIKRIFDLEKKKKGGINLVTHKKTVRFDDGVPFTYDGGHTYKHPILYFTNTDSSKSNHYRYVIFHSEKPNDLSFSIKEDSTKKALTAEFDSLSLNVVSNMLNFAEADKAKFDKDNYIYELFNKDNAKKLALKYHEKGTWFEIVIDTAVCF
jgi:hypothetical protein